jgi:hypothetical protein
VRILRRTVGCAVVGVGLVVGVFGLIALATDSPLWTRLAWFAVGIAALAFSFGLLRWMQRSEEREDAERSEQPGPTAGSRIRSYKGPRDDALSAFGRDARSLANQRYRVTGEEWEPMERSHPRLFVVLKVLEIALTVAFSGRGGWDLGTSRGTLTVTYHLGSSPPDAVSEVEASLARLRDAESE